MEQDVELLTELVQSLTNDVVELKKMVASQPPPSAPVDMRPTLEKVANAINGLRSQVDSLGQVKAPTGVAELKGIEEQIRQLQHQVRQSPANRISKAVQYGTGLLLVSVLTSGALGYWASKWREERNGFEESDWKWRGVAQMYPEVHQKLSLIYADSAAYFQARTVELEQAQQARQNAALWSQKAAELEGEKRGSKRSKN